MIFLHYSYVLIHSYNNANSVLRLHVMMYVVTLRTAKCAPTNLIHV